jgi:hypothetical protein
VVIILNNEHCFKDDPRYGQMLKRIGSGDLSKEDCKEINQRVIGYNDSKLPAVFEGKQSKNNFNQCMHTKTQQKIFYSGILKNDKNILFSTGKL